MKRLFFILLSSLILVSPASSNSVLNRFQVGFSPGFGLPQIQPSQFRFPISVLGKGKLILRLQDKYSLKADAAALTSFHLGKMNDQKGTFRFDLQFLSLALSRRWKENFDSSTHFFLGLGEYHLIREINQSKLNQHTRGLNLGLEFNKKHASVSTSIDLEWHLLFQPKSNPQVLTFSFGLLF